MLPLLPFRIAAVVLVLSAIAPVVPQGASLLAIPMDAALLLLVIAFIGLAAKLLWDGVRWVAWVALAYQGFKLTVDGLALLAMDHPTARLVTIVTIVVSVLLSFLLAFGLWMTRPDPYEDLATFD